MKAIVIALILFLALVVESTIIKLPLVLAVLIVLCADSKKLWVFPVGFGMGILVDILAFQIVGRTSLLFTIIAAAIFLYQRRFEVRTVQFVFFFTTIASFIALSISGVALPIMQAMLTGVVGSGVFLLMQIGRREKNLGFLS